MRPLFYLLCAAVLAACGGQDGGADDAAQNTASAGFSAAASAILNTPQDTDILTKAQTAMTDISASDIAAAAQTASDAAYAGETLLQPASTSAATAASAASLPAACEQYFQRADTCFAAQGEDAEALRHLNREARNELAAASAPSDNECRALNDSFNAVAARLGCR